MIITLFREGNIIKLYNMFQAKTTKMFVGNHNFFCQIVILALCFVPYFKVTLC